MSYYTQSILADDQDIRRRVAACVSREGVESPHPLTWADMNAWALSAAPGWDDAYAYALDTGRTTPGKDPDVISDGMILSAVQARLNGNPGGA